MSGKKNICLNMIVKNEKKVIERCLRSVKKYIDYWLIVDTGSTDGTQDIIKEVLKDIPGELYERPWKNFEHNRNEALKLAYKKARYLMFIDADEVLQTPPNFSFGPLDKDIFLITVKLPTETFFQRQLMISTSVNWFWQGVVHEQVYTTAKTTTHRFLENAYIYASDDGARSGEDSRYKFLHDAEVLEEALKKDPRNSRYVFYLANSYSNAKELKKALKVYERRAVMGGWDQEVFYSLYCIGRIQAELKMDKEICIQSFNKAFRNRPSRAEPLYWIANLYMDEKDYASAYKILKDAVKIPMSQDAMMVERTIYEYVMKWMLADCAYSIDRLDEASAIFDQLVADPNLPKDILRVMRQNQIRIKKILDKKCDPKSSFKPDSRQ